MFKVHDCIDFKIYIYIQLYKYIVTYTHNNHHCVSIFEKVKLTSMACDHIDFRQKYTLLTVRLVILITILNIIM